MLRLLKLLVSVAAGVALGLAATWASLRGDPVLSDVRSGAWIAWPRSGSADADPYTRAAFAHAGRLPLASAAGLQFIARTDDAGHPLEGRCAYTVTGPVPTAQYWSLTLLDPDGVARASVLPRSGFTSSEVVRSSNGGFVIAVTQEARPGNWLPVHGDAPFILMLSLYETALGTALATGGPVPVLPAIARTACP